MENNNLNDTLAGYLSGCKSDTAANILAGMQAQTAAPSILDIHGIPYLVTPFGKTVESMETLLDKPARLQANRTFNEPHSFCEYVNQFNSGKTARIYADVAGRIFTAVIDDCQPGAPSWREHIARLELKPAPEWTEWTAAAARAMNQQDLGEFFESHIRQIAEPAAADLLSGIRSVEMSDNWKCTSVYREGGDISFSMQRENAASVGGKADVKIPSRLTLAIAPFLCWTQYPLKVMLTYRLKEEKIVFALKLLEVQELLEKAFIDVREYIATDTEIPVLL